MQQRLTSYPIILNPLLFVPTFPINDWERDDRVRWMRGHSKSRIYILEFAFFLFFSYLEPSLAIARPQSAAPAAADAQVGPLAPGTGHNVQKAMAGMDQGC